MSDEKPSLDGIEDLDVEKWFDSLEKKDKPDFFNVNLKDGNWHIYLRFPNNSKTKKELLDAISFCRSNNVSFINRTPEDKKEVYYELEFKPNWDCKAEKMPYEFAIKLNAYLIVDDHDKDPMASSIRSFIEHRNAQAATVSNNSGTISDDQTLNSQPATQSIAPEITVSEEEIEIAELEEIEPDSDSEHVPENAEVQSPDSDSLEFDLPQRKPY